MSTNAFDVVIIGAGVIGHSVAFRLKRIDPSLKVAVLGDPMNSLMASRAAAGMLAPFCECETGDGFFNFCRSSLEQYPPFINELKKVSGVPVYLSMAGSIMPAKSVGEQWEDRLRFFREEKIPHEVWTVEQVKQKLPHLASDCGEVIWVGEGQVNNRQLHDALVAASRQLGVQVIGRNATGFHKSGNEIEAVVADGDIVTGKKFVLAAGSWSQQLARVLEVNPPLKPVKGQMCRVEVEENILPFTIHGIMTYIAPWSEGYGLVLGSTMEDRGFDPVVEEDVIQGLIDRAAAILPAIQRAPLVESWTGLRPAAEDRMPIMGRSGRYSNLYYSTGHYRNGILQTPRQADYMAQTILETQNSPIPEFDPTRYDL